MKWLILFNAISNILIWGYLSYKYNPFWLSFNRTFWMKKLTSISLMYRYHKSEQGSQSRSIFTLTLRNYGKWSEWDSEQFRKKNGK